MSSACRTTPTSGLARPIPRLELFAFVHELLVRHPSTAAVFDDFGVDARRGGARTIRDAAREDGADCCALLAALELSLADEAVADEAA